MRRFNVNLKRYLPIVLSVLGCAGVGATAYVAVQNNKKYEKEVKNTEEKDKPVIFMKCYYPTFLVGLGTVGCILGSGVLSYNHQARLISAYGLLNESYGRYKNKVIEHHGIEEHRKILNEIAFEDRKKVDLYVQGAFSCPCLNSAALSVDDRVYPVHDAYSNRWFKATISEIIDAEYHLNRNMCLGEVVLVNDYYNFMGLEQTIEGNELGWYLGNEDDYYWIDFSNELAHLPDGTEYIEIFIEYAPTTKWQEDW